jgi:lipopolysaccharide export LptBFGC system permease protein LptF
LFGRAIDAFSSRDEKEDISDLESELAKAKKYAEASKQAIKSPLGQNVKTKKERSEAEKEVQAAEKKIADLESKLKVLMEKDRQRLIEERKKDMEERQARMEDLKKPTILTTHTVESNSQALSHVALKYYKHATPPYWQYLLEHNKEVLGGSEKNIRTGMKLEIPELPEELKD